MDKWSFLLLRMSRPLFVDSYFAGQMVGSRPMKGKNNLHRMIIQGNRQKKKRQPEALGTRLRCLGRVVEMTEHFARFTKKIKRMRNELLTKNVTRTSSRIQLGGWHLLFKKNFTRINIPSLYPKFAEKQAMKMGTRVKMAFVCSEKW